ncbi:hypothetical protein NV379_15965 [Paenibacillus sp. N1-5-1-14]|uniref:hypothetical protein n=1 Tax=Paenibacillus radicibacter TaxID=2972488 RepID=UPI002159266E|nr:hypothetical protein [Paenibacillus radicibacter]MCR8644150.1 hypothetical protein [Paenibacillus radicibacter]
MNNGKYTIRFDRSGNRVESSNKEQAEPIIIPLHVDEYRVETRVEPVQETQQKQNTRFMDDVEYLDPSLLNQYTTDFGPWKSSFETETERVERIIRESQHEQDHKHMEREEPVYQHTYAQQEPIRTPFRSPEPQPPVFYQESYAPRHEPEIDEQWKSADSFWQENDPQIHTTYRKRPPMQWWKVAGAVAGAVVTGAAFGFFILTMLMGDGSKTDTNGTDAIPTMGQVSTITPNPVTVLNPSDTGSGSQGAVKAGDTAAGKVAPPASKSGVATVPVKIDARSYMLMQHGIFSSSASLQADVDTLKGKGLLPATEVGDKSTVYAGITMTKAESQRLSKVFKEKKIDVYAKPLDLPALTHMKWTGAKPDQVGTMLNTGSKLMATLSGIILPHMEETRLTAIDQATIQALKNAEQSWLTAASMLQDGGNASMAHIQNMTKSLTAAVTAIVDYSAKPGTTQLWQAQSAMMQYVLAEKAFQQSLTAA